MKSILPSIVFLSTTHVPGRVQSKTHGQWTHCAVCNVRLECVPRQGSHGQTTKMDNPGMMLRNLTGNYKPTAAICLAMQRKIDAEQQPNTLIRERMQEPQMVETKIQVTPTTTTTVTPPTMNADSPGQSSATSWQVTEDMNPNTLDTGY